MQKEMGLNDFRQYLCNEMGLRIHKEKWREAADLPLFLSKAATYQLCACDGVSFLAAIVEGGPSLPDLKRIASQVSARTGLPVVLVAQIDARQRKALVSQGIPFVVPGRQAFLPMLGFAASSKKDPSPLAEHLSPGAQAVLVTLIANPGLNTSKELLETTGMPSSSISRGLDELARRGIVSKSKTGREIVLERKTCGNDLLKDSLDYLRNPVKRTIYVKKDTQTAPLPLAAESALSQRSELAAPQLEQRAATPKALSGLTLAEVQRGELGDTDTVQIQIWTYNPLVAGKATIDDVSLALTLAGEGDERVIGQLNALFGEELW